MWSARGWKSRDQQEDGSHVISEMMEVTPMIGIEPQIVYHFGYPAFWALSDLTNKVNYFDGFNKNMHIYY